MKMSKPVIKYSPRGATGNIYWIVGQLRNIMRQQRRIDAFNRLWERVQMANSYDDALKIISEEVDLVEVDE